MPRITADALELQDLDAGYWFEIVSGGLDAVVGFRESVTVVPGKPGRIPRRRVADALIVVLTGMVHGEAGMGDDAAQSYLSRMDALRAVFDPLRDPDDPIVLTVHPDATGVGGRVEAGDTATMSVRFVRLVGEPAQGDQYRQVELECECVTDPPGWVISTAGS